MPGRTIVVIVAKMLSRGLELVVMHNIDQCWFNFWLTPGIAKLEQSSQFYVFSYDEQYHALVCLCLHSLRVCATLQWAGEGSGLGGAG